MKKISLLLALIIVGVLVVWFVNSEKVANNTPKEESAIVIGYIGPLTGPSAVLGMDAIKALEIKTSEINDEGGINGRKIQLITEDDQYLVKNTVSAYQKLTQVNKAKIVLVATYGGFLALQDRAAMDGVIMINPLDCNKAIADASRNSFCLATETESIGYVLADQMIKNKQMTAGIMYSTKDSFMNLVTTEFKARFEAAGGKTFVESFNYEDKDFKAQLSKLSTNKIDGLVLLGHDETGVIMKQARDLKINVPFYTTGTITSPGAQQASAGTSEGTVFAYWDASANNAASEAFVKKFTDSVGRPPILPLTTHPAHDTLSVIADVLANTSSEMKIADIKEGLLNTKNYSGITGTVTFDAMGGAPIVEMPYKLVKGAPVKL